MTADVPEPLNSDVKHLLARGEHAAAAAALWAAGHPRRAAAIYEQIFEHKEALNAFEAGGDIVGAVRAALELGDTSNVERLVTLAIAAGQGDALLTALQRAGALAEEGRVRLARGEHTLAAAAFERAGAFDRAAACLEDVGNMREAGLFLERHLATHPSDVEAGLRLGRILARFGRHDDGIALLQRAIAASTDPDVTMARAAPTLMMSFVHLGYEGAARAVLVRWQQAHGRLQQAERAAPLEVGEAPPQSMRSEGEAMDDFEVFMRSERAAALAAIHTAHPSSQESRPAPASENDLDDLFGGREREGEKREEVAQPSTAGDTLLLAGRYLLGEPLGGGGVGQVFRAFDAFADRPVAVKIFGAQVLSSQAVQSFARDARAFASLRHPAVAALVELNMPQGFIVTELVTAPTLEERMRQGGESGWLVPAIRSLLDVLASCHRTGLVHGGLKPTNVFLLPAGVRVVDVGAHRLLALRSTETGGLSSVWPYLSPEQLFGAPATASGDLYAVAAVIYRALTGVPPFARAEDDRRQAPARASARNPSVPVAWDDLLARALHPDATKRFGDAAEMDAALPALPASVALPPAASLSGESRSVALLAGASRYAKGALVHREGRTVRVYEGTDLLVERGVWLVEADDMAALRPLVVVARLWRGVQPVYDVIPEATRVVVARDASGGSADLVSLRAVPQGLMRDLAGVARALEWLHGQGLCLGGFLVERGLGPVGPRLRFAPAPLPIEATSAGVDADWVSFGGLVDHALDLAPEATLDGRGRILAMLHDRRLLDRSDLEVLGAEAPSLTKWPAFLEATTLRLVQGASARVVARLVANVVRGRDSAPRSS